MQNLESGLTNTSVVLLRNADYLVCESPLLMNLPADGLINELIQINPTASIHSFSNNFAQFQQHQHYAKQHAKVTASFSSVYEQQNKHDLVIMSFPKSKAELAFNLSMLAGKLADDARLLVVGEKKGGVNSTPKLTKTFLNFCTKLDSARHCMLFHGVFQQDLPPFELSQWFHTYPVTINDISIDVAALPGVFSQQGLDKGTRVMLEHFDFPLSGKVLDFGCGAGVIACYLAKKYPEITLDLLDVSALALASAEKTMQLNNVNGHCLASNSISELSAQYDAIVSNPPFHQGIKTHYHATETFLQHIRQHMRSPAQLFVIANSFLAYQPIMESAIGKTVKVVEEKGFTLYHTQK